MFDFLTDALGIGQASNNDQGIGQSRDDFGQVPLADMFASQDAAQARNAAMQQQNMYAQAQQAAMQYQAQIYHERFVENTLEAEEKTLRVENPGVKDAYEKYQIMLKLARS